jgi:hypothetical protein
MLEQAVGEPAGGGTDVGGDDVRDIERKFTESGLEFFAAAADESFRLLDLELAICGKEMSGLGLRMTTHPCLPGANDALRFFAALGEAALNQQLVESDAPDRGHKKSSSHWKKAEALLPMIGT